MLFRNTTTENRIAKQLQIEYFQKASFHTLRYKITRQSILGSNRMTKSDFSLAL